MTTTDNSITTNSANGLTNTHLADPTFSNMGLRSFFSYRDIRFMLLFGPTSSLLDIATFSINWFYWRFGDVADDAGVAIAQTLWFMEGSVTQTLVVFILCTGLVPFIQ